MTPGAMMPLWAVLSSTPSMPGSIGILGRPPSPEPIIGGEPTQPGEFDEVVAVQGPRGCTGTVVAPRLVLTAAHCVIEALPSTGITVYYGDAADPSMSVEAETWGVHPQYCSACDAADEDLFDFAYLTLPADFTVPDGYKLPIVDQALWDETMVEGGAVTIVGFGEDELGTTGIKRKVTTEIRRFTAAGTEFFAGGEFRDSCRGDSGGPAFVQLQDGTWRLAGITSRGSNPCGDGGFYGVPYWALAWVRDETGVDLLGPRCPAADCLDTAPPQSGCNVASRPATGTTLMMLCAVLIRLRRLGAITQKRRPRAGGEVTRRGRLDLR